MRWQRLKVVDGVFHVFWDSYTRCLRACLQVAAALWIFQLGLALSAAAARDLHITLDSTSGDGT